MTPFNQLSAGQTERLALLLEELGEVQQAVGKILHHGYDLYNPTTKTKGLNREQLEKELGDVKFAITLLCKCGDVSANNIWKAECDKAEKAEKVKQYLHHN